MNDRPQTSAEKGAGLREYAVLEVATFDARLRRYWFWQAALLMALSIVGIVFVPFWLLGIGQVWTRKLFESMQAELTERSLNYRKGVFFKVEKTIPLEQIQDLTLREGPLLKALGIRSLTVETAGQNSSGGGIARLTGIAEARVFRNLVLARRDVIKETAFERGPRGSEAETDVRSILEQIRDDVAAIRASVSAQ